MGFLIFLGVVAVIVLDYFVAKEFAFIACEKGYSQKKYFWWTFLLAAIGIPMVIALPSKDISNVIHIEDEIPEI